MAGLACARFLARAGWRVVVFDRMETPSPLGSGLILQPVGMAVLDALELGQDMRARGAPIHRLFGKVQPSGRVVLDVRYPHRTRAPMHGVGAHRGALFGVLLAGAQAVGVEFEFGREIVGADAGRLIFAGGSTSARFDLVVDALGVWSVLSVPPEAPLEFGALWTNVDWPAGDRRFNETALEQRYERARKMVGVLPIGGIDVGGPRMASFFWSLKHADLEDWRAGGLEQRKGEVARLWPETDVVLDQITDAEQMVFAAYAHRTLDGPAGRNVVHVGDSWHCASPQLGQGANMALLDAFALAQALGAHADLGAAMANYARMRRWHIRFHQAVSWMFTPAYQSDGAVLAWLRDWVLAPLSRIPPGPGVLAALVSGTIGSPLAAIRRHCEAGRDEGRVSPLAGTP